jgi:hypothetical protein
MAQFVTGEAARERFRELADQVDAAYAEMRALSSDAVGNEFRVELAERLETQDRTNRGLMYRVFGELADPPDEIGYVPVLADKLWARLRIPPKEIKRRMKMAGRIRPRRQQTTVTGTGRLAWTDGTKPPENQPRPPPRRTPTRRQRPTRDRKGLNVQPV